METKTLNTIKIIVLSIIAIALVGILIILLNKKTSFDYFQYNLNDLIHDEVIEKDINNILIEAKSFDINIEENNNNEIRVKVYAEKEEDISLVTNNESLEIKENKNSNHFCIGFCYNFSPKIIISVPKEEKISYDIESTSSDIILESNALNIKIKTISGDINIKNAENASIKTTSGDIDIKKVQELNLETISGDVQINEINKGLNIKTTSGDIDIKKMNLLKNSSIKTTSGDTRITSTNIIYFDTKTKTGDVTITNNNRNSEIELKIESVSGNIEIKNE